VARLRIVEAVEARGRVFELTGGETLVGRDEACQVVLRDRSLSRRHARLAPAAGGWLLLDQESGNGTFVNGQRVREAMLRDGDEVRFGLVRVRFEDPPQEPPTVVLLREPPTMVLVPQPPAVASCAAPAVPPPPPPPLEWASPAARNRSSLRTILVAVLVAIALVGVAGFLAWRIRGRPGAGSTPADAAVAPAAEAGPPLDAGAAIETGDATRLEELLAGGADPNAAGEDGTSLVQRAAWAGRADVAKILVSKGADLSRHDPLGLTPAERALAEGRCEAAVVLLPKEAVPAGKDGRTLLHRAAEGSCAGAVKELVARGVAVDATDAAGLAPLHVAALSGHADVLAALLASGASAAKATPSGRTALHLAALAGRAEAVTLLVGKGADPSARDAGGRSPLHLAAAGGDAATVAALLAAKADATLAGPDGTPLAVALAGGAWDAAELLAPQGP
jgi:ankyrin repeat protein